MDGSPLSKSTGLQIGFSRKQRLRRRLVCRCSREITGFPGHSAGKESTCNVRDLGSIPGLGRSPHSSVWPGEFHGMYSLWGHKESDTTEQLSLSLGIVTELGKGGTGWSRRGIMPQGHLAGALPVTGEPWSKA